LPVLFVVPQDGSICSPRNKNLAMVMPNAQIIQISLFAVNVAMLLQEDGKKGGCFTCKEFFLWG